MRKNFFVVCRWVCPRSLLRRLLALSWASLARELSHLKLLVLCNNLALVSEPFDQQASCIWWGIKIPHHACKLVLEDRLKRTRLLNYVRRVFKENHLVVQDQEVERCDHRLGEVSIVEDRLANLLKYIWVLQQVVEPLFGIDQFLM